MAQNGHKTKNVYSQKLVRYMDYILPMYQYHQPITGITAHGMEGLTRMSKVKVCRKIYKRVITKSGKSIPVKDSGWTNSRCYLFRGQVTQNYHEWGSSLSWFFYISLVSASIRFCIIWLTKPSQQDLSNPHGGLPSWRAKMPKPPRGFWKAASLEHDVGNLARTFDAGHRLMRRLYHSCIL